MIRGVFLLKTTLYDLIKQTPWNEVENSMREFYPDEDTTFFKELYWKLFNITPLPNETGAEFQLQLFDDEEELSEEEAYYEVEFHNEITDEMWSIYLGFYIGEESLQEISPEEIITHMLFEFLYGDIENSIA